MGSCDLDCFNDTHLLVNCDKLIGNAEYVMWTQIVNVPTTVDVKKVFITQAQWSSFVEGNIVLKPVSGGLVAGDKLNKISLFGTSKKGCSEFTFKNVEIISSVWNPVTKELDVKFSGTL